MDVQIETVQDVTVIRPEGPRLDAANYSEFKDAVCPLVKEHRRVVLDLSDFRLVDSSGMGVILYCIRQSTVVGGQMKISCSSEPVRIAFDLIRLRQLVDIFANREDAVQAFLGGAKV